MNNRSNINLVGNTTQAINVGSGAGVFKCKSGGNNLQFKSISATGGSIQIFSTADEIRISGGSSCGGGSGANGLSTRGGNIVLGGILTGVTVISGNSEVLNIGTLISPLATMDIRATNMTMCGSGALNLNGATQADINGGNIRFHLDSSCGVITDNSGNGKGLQYVSDYSATFGNQSLVTKKYVFSQTSGGSSSIGWSNLANGSTVAGCGTCPSGTSITNDTFYGTCAGNNITTGESNVGIGTQALAGNSSGCNNIGIGLQTLYNTGTGCDNVAIGFVSMQGIVNGKCNVAVGSHTLQSTTSGCHNIALGAWALCCNTTGNFNIAHGLNALYNNVIGLYNVAIGTNANRSSSGGINNVAIGTCALCCNMVGNDNVVLGRSAMGNGTGGTCNIVLGVGAMNNNCCGCGNISLGRLSLISNNVGCDNIALGIYAGANTNGCNNVFIGRCAGYSELGSNMLYIGICTSCQLICGDFIAKTLRLDAAVSVISLTCTSDERLKTNIQSLSVSPVNIEYKQFKHKDFPNKLSVGVIAQELCLTHPDLVSVDDKGFLGVNYGELHSLEIAYLKCKVKELEEKLNSLT